MPSPNLICAVLYIAVFLACSLAARAAAARSAPRRQVGSWALCGVSFVLLAGVRIFTIENRLRDTLRQYFRASGDYDGRAAMQRPLVMTTLLGLAVLAICAAILWRKQRHARTEPELMLALIAVAGYVPLYALRLISWHNTDRILYGGGVHLNWVIDLALTSIVAVAALVSVTRGGARRRSR